MAAQLDSVSKIICEKGEWKVTNLQLQKILYMAQMFFLGRSNGDRLAACEFEAWDYGPVVPELYHKVKMFGGGPIRDVFSGARPFSSGSTRLSLLNEVAEVLLPKRPGELVDITHWKNGAWAKHYVPGVKGIPIPDSDILAEYRARLTS